MKKSETGKKKFRLPSVLDVQQGGAHYKNRPMQPIEFSHANNLSFNCGSVVKYVTRHRDRGREMDLKKAIHYLQIEMQQVYGIRSRIEYDEGR